MKLLIVVLRFFVDPKIHQGILKGHTDAVWDLVVHRDRDLLATCSSDGTCKIWNWKASHEPVISLTADPGMDMLQHMVLTLAFDFSQTMEYRPQQILLGVILVR